MDAFLAPIFVFSQATLSTAWIGALAALAIVSLIYVLYRRRLPWRDLKWVAAMPIPWLLLAMWGGMNRAGPGVYDHLSGVLTPLALLQYALTLGLTGVAIARAKGARLIVGALAVINAWFAFLGGLLVVMMVSGSWM